MAATKSHKIHKISLSWNKGSPNFHFDRLFGYGPHYSHKLETRMGFWVQNPRWPPPKSTKKIPQNYEFEDLMHLCSIGSCELYKKVNTYLIYQDNNWIRIHRLWFLLWTLSDYKLSFYAPNSRWPPQEITRFSKFHYREKRIN